MLNNKLIFKVVNNSFENSVDEVEFYIFKMMMLMNQDICKPTDQNLFSVHRFSMAKKCSNEGRALMQLDFRQFVLKLEAISDMKPLPHQDLVKILGF